MAKYKILIDNKEKIFTYYTDEYVAENNFIVFTDDRNTKRHIPIHRLIEVIECD